MDEIVQDAFGWVATCLTMSFYISPIFPFINVLKGKLNYEDTPGILVTSIYINCFCWYIYGDTIFSDPIKICHLIGVIISFLLMLIYLAYEIKKYTVDAILNILIILTGSYAVYKGFTIMIDDDTIIGKFCFGTSCLVFVTPIQLIYRVMKDKNYNLISIYLSSSSLFSSCFLIIHGVFIKDLYIVFPNVIGIILAKIQIFIFLKYKRKYPGIGERESTSTIGIETNENEKDKKEEDPNKDDENAPPTEKEKPVKIFSKIGN